MTTYKMGDVVQEISVRENAPAASEYDKFVGLEHYISGEVLIRQYGGTEMLNSAMKVFQAGDILVARRNVYLRRASMVDFDGLTSGDSIVLRAKNPKIAKLLPFILNSDRFWDYADQHADGTMSKRLSPKILMQYEFALPSEEEQDKLIELLWSIDRVKQAYKQLISVTDELVKSQFIEMFMSNKQYPLIPISSLVDRRIKKIKDISKKYEIIRYIDISSIDNGLKRILGYTEFPINNAPLRAQQVLKKGDILVSTVRPNLKNIAINPYTEENIVASTGFCILRCNNCLPEYIWGVIISDAFTKAMCEQASGISYPAIRDNDILNYLIPDAPKDVQEKFADLFRQSDKSKFELTQALDALNATYKCIINEYLG